MATDLTLRITVSANAQKAKSEVKSLASSMKSSMQSVSSATQQASTSTNAFGSIIKTIAGGAIQVVGNLLVDAGRKAVQFAEDGVKAAGNYQEGLTSLVTGAGETKSNLQAVGQGILDISTQTATGAAQLTSGMFLIESSGQRGAQALETLRAAAEGAKVGQADLASMADGLTTTLTDYHISADKATSTTSALVQTMKDGKMHMQDLASSLGAVLPTASALGVKFPQVAAAMATMTNSGMHAKQAAQNLANTIRSLAAPNATAVKSMKSVGISAQQLKDALDQQGLTGAIQLVQQQVGKKFPAGSVAAVTAFKNIMGGATGYATALKLGGANMQAFQANVKNISSAMASGQGAVQGWADVQADYNFQTEQAKQAISNLQISIGTALLPVLTTLMQKVNPLIIAFSAWITKSGILTTISNGLMHVMDGLSPILDGIGTAFHALTTPVDMAQGLLAKTHSTLKPLTDSFDRATRIIQKVTPVAKPMLDTFDRATGVFKQTNHAVNSLDFKPLLAALRNLGTSLTPILSSMGQAFKSIPWGAIASGANALASGSLSVLTGMLNGLASGIRSVTTWFNTSMMPAIRQAEPGFKSLGSAIGSELLPNLKAIWDAASHVVGAALSIYLAIESKLLPIVVKLSGFLASQLGPAIKFLSPYFRQAMQAVGQFADEIATRVMPIINNFFGNLSKALDQFISMWKKNWPLIAPILKGVWDEIVGVVKIAWAIVSGIIKIGLDILGGNWKQAWTDFKDMLSGVWDGIKTYIRGGLEVLEGIFHAFIAKASSWGSSLIQNFINGIQSMIGNVGNVAHQIMQTVANFLKPGSPTKSGIGQTLMTWGPKIGQYVAQGLADQQTVMADAVNTYMQPLTALSTYSIPSSRHRATHHTTHHKAVHHATHHTVHHAVHHATTHHKKATTTSAGFGPVSSGTTTTGTQSGTMSGIGSASSTYATYNFAFNFNFTQPLKGATTREQAHEIAEQVEQIILRQMRGSGILQTVSSGGKP